MNERAPLSAVEGLSRTAALPPPPPRRRPEPAEQPDRQTDPKPEVITKPASDERATKRPRHAPATDVTVQTTTLSLPVDIIEALRHQARTDGLSQAEVLLDAIVAAQDDLALLIKDAGTQTVQDGLFLRIKPSDRGPTATLSIRLLTANLSAIDELVHTHNAPSRSALCAAALRHHLKEVQHA